jgi:hypothetical protein
LTAWVMVSLQAEQAMLGTFSCSVIKPILVILTDSILHSPVEWRVKGGCQNNKDERVSQVLLAIYPNIIGSQA